MLDRLFLGTRKGLVTLKRGPSGWAYDGVSHLGVPVTYALRDPATDTVWAALDHGHWGVKLQISADEGATWREIPAPAYPAGSEVSKGKAATTGYIWVMEPDPHRPGRMYAGTEPGGLFVADDAGEFTLVSSLWNHPTRSQWFGGGRDSPGIHSIVFDPRDPARIGVAVSCGGYYESTDGGDAWAPRNLGLEADFLVDPKAEVGQDPHLVVRSAANPDVLWQQNHCSIYRSADNGAHWDNVGTKGTPAYFGFAIATPADDADTAWVVPAIDDECRTTIDGALVVCRTTDGGETWEEQRNGLPQSGCFDLVFRHALDIEGDVLAMGSTTGNVWISEDRGERWERVAGHFAPIYSVRFA